MRLAAQAVLNGRIGKLRKIHTSVPAGDVTAPPVTNVDPIPKELNYDLWLGPCPDEPYNQRRVQQPSWGDKEDFIRCVKSRQRTMQDVEYGHRTCSLCQLGHISVKLGGREITWDPAKEQSPDPDVNRLTRRPEWRGHWLDEHPRA